MVGLGELRQHLDPSLGEELLGDLPPVHGRHPLVVDAQLVKVVLHPLISVWSPLQVHHEDLVKTKLGLFWHRLNELLQVW